MKLSYGRRVSLALAAAALWAGAGCAGTDETVEQLHVRFEWQDFVGDTIITAESGCFDIDVSADGEVKTDDPFLSSGGSAELRITRSLVPQGLRVTGVSDTAGGALLVDKLYSPDFIRSGVTDVIDVMPPRGREAKIAHRGVPNCDDDIDLFRD